MNGKPNSLNYFAGLVLAFFLWNGPVLADAITERAEQSVVQIKGLTATGYSGGTGFVISREGYIVTNWHVVEKTMALDEKYQFITVLLPGENEPASIDTAISLIRNGRQAKVVFHSASRDLAILKLSVPIANPPLTLSPVPPVKEEKIITIGYPGAADEIFHAPTVDPSVTAGVVARMYSAPFAGEGDSIPVIQHNAQINHGNSGGPLLNSCGYVVGVNTWVNNTSLEDHGGGKYTLSAKEGIFYSSSITNLLPFLSETGVKATIAGSACTAPFVSPEMRDGLMAGGGVAALSLAGAFFFRRPRKYVLDAASRSMEAVSRRVGRDEAPARSRAVSGNEQWVRFVGQGEASAFSSKVATETLKRSPQGVVIGRGSESAAFVIGHKEISRRHAVLKLRDGQVVLEDAGSTNGTRLNERSLSQGESRSLKDGDKVAFGTLQFLVRVS